MSHEDFRDDDETRDADAIEVDDETRDYDEMYEAPYQMKLLIMRCFCLLQPLQAIDIWKLLSDGSYIYICGDAKGMSQVVHLTNQTIVQQEVVYKSLLRVGRLLCFVWLKYKATDIWKLLLDGSYIYICGDAKGMSQVVHLTNQTIVQQEVVYKRLGSLIRVKSFAGWSSSLFCLAEV
ncbi:cytochrome P450 reductase [Tanacetum coccineum]